jgi:hypothetical protein
MTVLVQFAESSGGWIRFDWLIMMEWDWHLRITADTGLSFILWVNVSGEPWWWCRLGITPDLSTRAHWQSYQQRHLERVGGMDEGMRILHIQYLWYINWSITCHKILRHGTSGCTSHPQEGVLRVFIALKNPLSHPGLNPWLLGPVASTLTTTPLRWRWIRSFPLSWYHSTMALYTHISPGGWTIGLLVATVQRYSLIPSTWTTTTACYVQCKLDLKTTEMFVNVFLSEKKGVTL